MWREVHTENSTEQRMHVNVTTASHIKLKSVGDAWAVVVSHYGVESLLRGTMGTVQEAEAKYVELINELESRNNSAAIVAEHQAEQIMEAKAPKAFMEPRRIR
jgi:hypothetical protein